jgi:seryl-tRNA synthetase
MIDVAVLRNQPDLIAESLRRRGMSLDLEALAGVDRDRRRHRATAEELRAEQKELGKAIATSQGDERQAALDRAAELAAAYQAALSEADALDARFDEEWARLPNLVDPTAADGVDEDDAVELRTWGEPRTEEGMRDHLELGQALGLIDIERAAKVSGSRFGYVTGPLVTLQLAVVRWAVDRLQPHGFVPVIPPVLVREHALFGTGFFPADRDQIYGTDDDLYLVGTSEVSLAAMHGDEILDGDSLPLRYVGISTCFRRESGTYGKDTRGLFRVHQFDKVEMFSFCHPDRSMEEHDFLLAREEELARDLGIPHRVVNVAAGDLGGSAAKKYDIEAWFPGQGRYREITSTSNTTDFQARRLRIRYRSEDGNRLVHTLNGTAVTGRWLIAILENYQRDDGSVEMPAALQPYTGSAVIGG